MPRSVNVCPRNRVRYIHITDHSTLVEQDHLEEVELAEGPQQVEVTFGAEQFLHQGVGRDAQHAAAGLDQRVPDGAQPVAFAHAGQTEGEHIGRRLEDRHAVRSTVVTSQLPVDKWHDAVGDPTLADAILDRLVHNAYKLELKGDSMRKRGRPSTRT